MPETKYPYAIPTQRRSLREIIERGNLEAVKLYHTENKTLDTEDTYGNTALHYAAMYGHQEIGEYLIEHKVDINVKNNKRSPPFLEAIRHQHWDFAKYLVHKGAELYLTDREGNNAALLVARHNTQAALDMISFLVKEGISVHIKGHQGWTMMHMAAKYGGTLLIPFLVNCGLSIDVEDDYGNTPTHAVVSEYGGVVAALRLMTKYHANMNKANDAGFTPLHIAVLNNDAQAVEALLACGVDVNIASKSGYAAIHMAADTGNMEIVRLLMSVPGITYARTRYFFGKRPSDLASRHKFKAVAALLRLAEKGAIQER